MQNAKKAIQGLILDLEEQNSGAEHEIAAIHKRTADNRKSIEELKGMLAGMDGKIQLPEKIPAPIKKAPAKKRKR